MQRFELEYRILKKLEENPKLTQRQIATELGLSLGKTNYVIRALIDRGFVKLNNFRTSNNKINYVYLLTINGLSEKAELAKRFLEYKSKEYDKLKKEISMIEKDLLLNKDQHD